MWWHTPLQSQLSLGGRNQEGHGLRLDHAKNKLVWLHVNKQARRVVHAYNPSCVGNVGKKIVVPGQPQQKAWDSVQKIMKAKNKAGGVAQVVQHLLSNMRLWVQTSETPKKRKEKRISFQIRAIICRNENGCYSSHIQIIYRGASYFIFF
jgi:hypothetical protein